jgi:hypothetical protein
MEMVKWHKKTYADYIAWSQFVKVIHACRERDTHYLRRLTKLHQISSIAHFTSTFKQLAIHTENLTDSFYKECFISGLKEDIRAQVRM